MQVLEYWVHVFVYEALVLLGLGCLFLPAMLWAELLADGPLRSALIAVALPFLLVGVLGGSWIAHHAARLRVLEHEGFIAAFVDAFNEARLVLAGLPGIGKPFAVRPRERRPFEPPDDPRFGGAD